MGEVKLLKIPREWEKKITGSTKRSKAIRKGYLTYSPDEVIKYVRMYLSGYSASEIAEHFDVSEPRVYNGMRRHFMVNLSYWRGLSRANKLRRLGGLKLIKVKNWHVLKS